MKKLSFGTATDQIVNLLKEFESGERKKIVSAALLFLDDPDALDLAPGSLPQGGTPQGSINSLQQSAKGFFDQKKPVSKQEELAVAARYREIQHRAEEHTKDELREVYAEARRNFDNSHYADNINNAKNSGLFNKSDKLTLSYNGQQFVDALPDREEALKHKKAVKKRKATKKKAKK